VPILVHGASWREMFSTTIGCRRKERKKNQKRKKSGRPVEIGATMEKSKRCAAFSHSGLDKTERKDVLGFIHNFTQAPCRLTT